MVSNNNKQKSVESKIWLGDDGIIRLKIEKDFNINAAEIIMSKFKEMTKIMPAKPNVLIDISASSSIPGSIFRKRMVEIVREISKEPGFNKVAEWGKCDQFLKTITSFIIGFIRLKNFKYFETEEEAIKWLKED